MLVTLTGGTPCVHTTKNAALDRYLANEDDAIALVIYGNNPLTCCIWHIYAV